MKVCLAAPGGHVSAWLCYVRHHELGVFHHVIGMDCIFVRTIWAKAVFLFVFVAASSHGAFVSRKAPQAIISSYDEVFPVVVGASDDKPHPSQLTVEIRASGENFTLVLSLNRGLLPPTFKSIHYNQNGQEVITEKPVNCFYHGFVTNHPHWTATMSTCQGMSGSFGDPSLMDQLHHVEPLTSDKALNSRHAYYTGGQLGSTGGTCGTTHNTNQNVPNIYHGVEKRAIRSKVSRQTANGELILEWILVSDYRQYQMFNSSVPTVDMRALQIANLVDSLWKPLGIRVVLVQTITWSNGDMVNVVSDSSTLLSRFQTYQRNVTTSRDGIMLLTGITLSNNIVGLAFVGTMCGSSATAETQDGGRMLEATASTAAHELGHNLNMAHDDDPSRNYTCNCTDSSTRNKCIMASALSNPSPTRWSNCSSYDLMTGLNPAMKNLGRCLTNDPTMTVGAPVCGNGIREGTEICDCGSIMECKDPCCNATSCQLKAEAQCGSGTCCQSCKFKPHGTTCRNATNECDILEYCSGSSSQCPADLYRQNGQSCASGQGYCYNGICPTLDSQCKYFYGQNNGNGYSCYNFNTQGDYFGHCGVTAVGYIPCNASNVFCGSLFCNATQTAKTNGPNHVSTPHQWGYTTTCISFTLTSTTKAANPSYTNPGFVADGTKCSSQSESLCIQQQCVPVSSLSVTPCPAGKNGTECSGNGACNNLGTCSCDAMYTGTSCSFVYGAQDSSMMAVDSGAIAGAVIGTLMAAVIIIMAIVVVVVLYLRSRQKKSSVVINASSMHVSRQNVPKPVAGIEMGSAHTEGLSDQRSNAKKAPPPPARPHFPPPHPTNDKIPPPSRPHAPPSYSTNEKTPPPRPHAPPPYPSNDNATQSVAPAAPSRPLPPSKMAPVRPKPVLAPRPEVEVDFKAVKPAALPRK